MCAQPAGRLLCSSLQLLQGQAVPSPKPFLGNKSPKRDSANSVQEIILSEVPLGSSASRSASGCGVEDHRKGGDGAGVCIGLRNVKRHKPPKIRRLSPAEILMITEERSRLWTILRLRVSSDCGGMNQHRQKEQESESKPTSHEKIIGVSPGPATSLPADFPTSQRACPDVPAIGRSIFRAVRGSDVAGAPAGASGQSPRADHPRIGVNREFCRVFSRRIRLRGRPPARGGFAADPRCFRQG